MEKRIARELIFEQIFLAGFYPLTEADKECALFLQNDDLLKEAELLQEKALSETEIEKLSTKANAVIAMKDELDAMIDAVAENWKTYRMPRVDLSILRLALYEMKFDDAIPLKVAINEAVELAKKYGGDSSPAFVNAILGKLANE